MWLWFCICEYKSQLQRPDLSLCSDSAGHSKRTSVSSFQSVVDSDSAASINLNMEQNNVNFHIKKQSKYPHVPPTAEQKCKYFHTAMADRYVSPALNIFFSVSWLSDSVCWLPCL